MMEPMAEYSFTARDGQVEVRRDDRMAWVGRIHDVAALDAFSLPGSEDGIVVLDWMDEPEGVQAWQPYRNLLRVGPDGTEIWRADLPGGEKSFTKAGWEEGSLIACTWTHRCVVDPGTGHLMETTVTG
jgi:hypothetical protein